MRYRTLLLAVCLWACLPAIRAQAFCEGAAEVSTGAPGIWLVIPEEAVPEDVLNVTLQTFEANFVAGMSDAADALEPDELWVPCSPDQLQYTIEGCRQETGDGGAEYQLRFNLTCDLGDHQDGAEFEAAVAVSAAGEFQINITAVELQVEGSHTDVSPCLDPNCEECTPLLEGTDLSNITTLEEVVEVQQCDACAANYTQDETGACVSENGEPEEEISIPMGAALAEKPSGQDSYCGAQFYISGTDASGRIICSRCTRFGCNFDGDCRACNADERFPTCTNGQVCWKSCDTGYFSDLNGGCRKCSNFIGRCVSCFRCAGGQGCVNTGGGSLFCSVCETGYVKAGDGSGQCVAVNHCDDTIAGCATCIACPKPGMEQCHGGKMCTSCKKGFEPSRDGTARCRQVPLQ